MSVKSATSCPLGQCRVEVYVVNWLGGREGRHATVKKKFVLRNALRNRGAMFYVPKIRNSFFLRVRSWNPRSDVEHSRQAIPSPIGRIALS